jgi:hypothetical protein
MAKTSENDLKALELACNICQPGTLVDYFKQARKKNDQDRLAIIRSAASVRKIDLPEKVAVAEVPVSVPVVEVVKPFDDGN